jgi:hypothetical protein
MSIIARWKRIEIVQWNWFVSASIVVFALVDSDLSKPNLSDWKKFSCLLLMF